MKNLKKKEEEKLTIKLGIFKLESIDPSWKSIIIIVIVLVFILLLFKL